MPTKDAQANNRLVSHAVPKIFIDLDGFLLSDKVLTLYKRCRQTKTMENFEIGFFSLQEKKTILNKNFLLCSFPTRAHFDCMGGR